MSTLYQAQPEQGVSVWLVLLLSDVLLALHADKVVLHVQQAAKFQGAKKPGNNSESKLCSKHG